MNRFWLAGLSLAALLLAVACSEKSNRSSSVETRAFAAVQFGADGPVWSFINKGAELYLDRNPTDGADLTESIGAQRTTLPIELSSKNGATQYREMTVGLLLSPTAVTPDRPQQLFVEVHVSGDADFCQRATIPLVTSLDDVQPIQIDAPLTMILDEENLKTSLVVGGPDVDLAAGVGTPHGSIRGAATVCPSDPKDNVTPAFPPGVVPMLDVVFPAREPNGSPIFESFALDASC